jgi:hypothetical protein
MGEGRGSDRIRAAATASEECVLRAGDAVRARLTVAAFFFAGTTFFFAGIAFTFIRFGRLALRDRARGLTEPLRGAGFFARPVFNDSPRLTHSADLLLA